MCVGVGWGGGEKIQASEVTIAGAQSLSRQKGVGSKSHVKGIEAGTKHSIEIRDSRLGDELEEDEGVLNPFIFSGK